MGEGVTEIARRNAAQESDILFGNRTIQSIPGAMRGAALGGGARSGQIPGEWFSGSGVNQEERKGRRRPDDEQTWRHPPQDDARHVRAKIRRRAETGHDAWRVFVRYVPEP